MEVAAPAHRRAVVVTARSDMRKGLEPFKVLPFKFVPACGDPSGWFGS
jgi:hypothetical protein